MDSVAWGESESGGDWDWGALGCCANAVAHSSELSKRVRQRVASWVRDRTFELAPTPLAKTIVLVSDSGLIQVQHYTLTMINYAIPPREQLVFIRLAHLA